MKKLFIYSLLFFVFSNALAQTSTKNHLVDDTYHQWKWNENYCLNKWSVTFENKTNSSISSITFLLIIKDKETSTIRYKKTHTVNYIIGPGEVVPSPYFILSQELCELKNIDNLNGYYKYTEVISFK